MLKELVDRITAEGKHLGSGILKVDGFMNHQIDPVLMKHIGEEFARRFASVEATRILTAEASGIAPALAAGMVMNLPIVFAKKKTTRDDACRRDPQGVSALAYEGRGRRLVGFR